MLFPLDSLLPNHEIIRVFPTRTHWTPNDAMAFIGEPPLFRPGTRNTPVRISVTFRWQRRHAEHLRDSWRMFYDDVQVGGPAYGTEPGEFVPGRFLKLGCTITSRGCPKQCGWCNVPRLEGKLRTLQIRPGWIVQDNNLLACPEPHLVSVFDMLRGQRRRIYFNGGLDKHFLQPWHRTLFDSIRIGELWFACDLTADLPWLERAAVILEGIPLRKRRCYTMIGFDDESVRDADRRMQKVLALGFMPFCQLYQPPDRDEPKMYSQEWRDLRRKWCRPAAYMKAAD